jgi:hypothetical protein
MEREFWAILWCVSFVASAIIVFGWVLLGSNEVEELP